MEPSGTQQVRPCCATGFYPGDAEACHQQLDQLLASVHLPGDLPPERLGGLVPHAGWVYSGQTAAYLWKALAESATPPQVVVLLGAVHVRGVHKATVCDADSWATPLGPVALDSALRSELLLCGAGAFDVGSEAHLGEHSLEVQVPFVRRLLPGASILPVQVPADDGALEVGRHVADAIRCDGRRVAVVASSDLTHYGDRYGFSPVGTGPEALLFGRDNDRRLVEQALSLSASGVLSESRSHRNACGPGALAAAITAARALGHTKTRLLHQTTSHDARPGLSPEPSLFVGYASLLFGR